MSLEGVTAAAARAIAEIGAVKASYAALPMGQAGVVATPADVSETPSVVVNYEGFELTAGSPEHIGHILRADIWTRGRTSAEGEAVFLPIATAIIAQMRLRVGLFGTATLGKVIRGGPPRPEQIGNQPFIVFPVFIRVQELTIQNYTLGPSS